MPFHLHMPGTNTILSFLFLFSFSLSICDWSVALVQLGQYYGVSFIVIFSPPFSLAIIPVLLIIATSRLSIYFTYYYYALLPLIDIYRRAHHTINMHVYR